MKSSFSDQAARGVSRLISSMRTDHFGDFVRDDDLSPLPKYGREGRGRWVQIPSSMYIGVGDEGHRLRLEQKN